MIFRKSIWWSIIPRRFNKKQNKILNPILIKFFKKKRLISPISPKSSQGATFSNLLSPISHQSRVISKQSKATCRRNKAKSHRNRVIWSRIKVTLRWRRTALNLKRTVSSSSRTVSRRSKANSNRLKEDSKWRRASSNLKYRKDRTFWFRARRLRLQCRFISAKSKLERNKVLKSNKPKIARNTQFHNSNIRKIRNQLWVFKRLTVGQIKRKMKGWWPKRYQEESTKLPFLKTSARAIEKAKKRK